MKEKVCFFAWKSFLLFFTLTFGTIVLYCYRYSQEGESLSQLFLYSFICFIAVSGFYFLLTRLEAVLEKYNRFLFPAFLLSYGIFLWVMCYHSRGIPKNDSGMVNMGGMYMAGLSEDMAWHYFARCNNNIMPAVFLGLIYRLGHLLGLRDVYYAILFVNVLQVIIAMYCIYQIGYRMSDRKRSVAWLGMLLLGSYFAVFGHTQSVYTDAFSFSFGIAGAYIWLKARDQGTRARKCMFLFLAGIVWGVGAQIKATAVISLVAATGFALLYDDWRGKLEHFISVAVVLVFILVCSQYAKTLPSMEYYDTWAYPTTYYFVGLGLERDGTFSMESEFFNTLGGIYGMEEKKAYARGFIKDNWRNFFDRNHVVMKLVKNFADGKLRADDFFQGVDKRGFVYECIAWDGERNPDYRGWITGHWYMLLIMVSLTGLTTFLKSRKEEPDPCIFISMLSIFGIVFYMMISETNNRQIYNHLPWIACVAALGIARFWMVGSKAVSHILKTSKRSEYH